MAHKPRTMSDLIPTAALTAALVMSGGGSAATGQQVDLTETSITALQQAFEAGDITSEEAVSTALARIERFDPYYNAFVAMNPEALSQAREIDARRERGEPLGPLAGVPVVVKDSMDYAGLPTTGGWEGLSVDAGGINLVPERHAPVVQRLVDAGAIVLGKTNTPFLSTSGTHANDSWHGPTYSAVDRDIAPGGSSTGTATAVAAGFAVVGLAEETGGSIQNPAAAQELVGVKPTFGLVPSTGVMPVGGSTRDVMGPHARSVTDAAILLDAIAGYTADDPKTIAAFGNMPTGGYAAQLDAEALKGARIGLYGPGWRNDAAGLSPETEELYQAAVAELEALGAQVVQDPFADSGFAQLARRDYFGFLDIRGIEQMPHDMDRYLARYPESAPVNSLNELIEAAGVDFLGEQGRPAVSQMNEISDLWVATRADPQATPDLTAFADLRTEYLRLLEDVMERHDLDAFAFPQMREALPGIFSEEIIQETTVSEINIAGVPAVTVPAGRYREGSPFALLFVGGMWSEADLLNYAYAYEQKTQHRKVPTLAEAPYDAAPAAE